MYARLTTVQVMPEKAQEVIDLYASSVVPAAQQQPGCQGTWLFIDRTSGKGVSVSLWDTAANLEAGEASGYYQEQVGKFGPLMTAPPVREMYEVAVLRYTESRVRPGDGKAGHAPGGLPARNAVAGWPLVR
jgi:quinol monooxygenase YgiN